MESAPVLKTTEILTPTAEIIQPAAISHQFRSEIHKPIIKTTEFITPAAKLVHPYIGISPGTVSHQFTSELLRTPTIKTAEIISPIKTEIIETQPLIELKSAPTLTHSTKTEVISNPLLKSSIIGTSILGGSPLIQNLEHRPLLKKSEITHSYVESTKSGFLGVPHGVVGYTPLSKIAIAPYARLGAEALLVPSIGATDYLVHQPLGYLSNI